MAKLKITQTRSALRKNKRQKRTIEALGLGRPNRTVTHEDTPQMRGMVEKVQHLVEVEDVDE